MQDLIYSHWLGRLQAWLQLVTKLALGGSLSVGSANEHRCAGVESDVVRATRRGGCEKSVNEKTDEKQRKHQQDQQHHHQQKMDR
jgi:hypothetical protein